MKPMSFWVILEDIDHREGIPWKFVDRTASRFLGSRTWNARGPTNGYWNRLFRGSYPSAIAHRNASKCCSESERHSFLIQSMPKGHWLGSCGGGKHPCFRPSTKSPCRLSTLCDLTSALAPTYSLFKVLPQHNI